MHSQLLQLFYYIPQNDFEKKNRKKKDEILKEMKSDDKSYKKKQLRLHEYFGLTLKTNKQENLTSEWSRKIQRQKWSFLIGSRKTHFIKIERLYFKNAFKDNKIH